LIDDSEYIVRGLVKEVTVGFENGIPYTQVISKTPLFEHFKTAEPLFIGSIPIAASNKFNRYKICKIKSELKRLALSLLCAWCVPNVLDQTI
jgi:hypothetical protein